MADIRKTFNFRAGVQVDDDVFIVRGEQVGIGTTIPTQSLDVRGNAKVVGILTAQNTDFSAGISTFGDVKIGTGISISASSGIISATKFSGDGSLLQNVPTSAWVQYNQLDDNGLSVVSIAKSTGNVGVATTGASSNNDFQVGSDPQDGFSKGVGIGSDGNIYASGIITATTFSGTLVGTVATVSSTQGNFSDHISVGNTVSVGGTVGLGSTVFFGNGVEARFGGSPSSPGLKIYNNNLHTTILSSNTATISAGTGIQIFGLTYNRIRGDNTQIVTSSGTQLLNTNTEEVILKYSGTEKLKTTNEGVLVSGGATFTGNIDANGDLDVDGHAELDNVNVSGVSTFTGAIDANGDLDVDGQTDLDDLAVAGVSTFTGAIDANGDLDVDGHTELDNVNVSGISTFVGNSKFDGLVGIQTATPQVQFHVWENDEQVARFQSNQTSAYISFVDQTSTFTPYVGANANALIFGNTSQGELARISGIGSLGIGRTDPAHKLDVVGTSKFSGVINADGGVVVGTAATMNNSGFRGNLTGDVTGSIINAVTGNPLIAGGVLSANVNATGISTFATLNTSNLTATTRVAVQTNTFSNDTVDVELHSDVYVRGSVSVGSTGRSAVDFSDVVNVPDDSGDRAKAAYMIPPKITTTQRNALRDTYDATGNTAAVDGAMIYNTSTNRLEIRMSGAWYGIGTVV